jgi:hypothetical protein
LIDESSSSGRCPSSRSAKRDRKRVSSVVQAARRRTERVDVAEAVEHRERIAVLEDPRAIVDPRRGREDVVLLADADRLFGHPGHYFLGRRPADCAASRS